MVLMRLLSFCFFAAFLVCLASNPVRAGYEYNIAYNSGTMVVIVPDEKPKIFPRDFYGVRPIRDPYNPATKMTLRFYSVGNVSGCAKIVDSNVNSEVKKQEMRVSPTDSEIDLKHEKPRYTNYDCKTELNESYFDVPVDIGQLNANKTKKISIKSTKYGNFIDLNVVATASKITFSSRYNPGPGLPGANVSMDYWLYPPRTIILSVPSAKTGQDVIPQIKDFAFKKGYQPIEEILPGFKLAENETGYYFFFDPTGHIRDQLKTPEDSLIVGQIQFMKTVYGANGAVEEPTYLDVHASIPGHDQ